jgi:hypothetical protein
MLMLKTITGIPDFMAYKNLYLYVIHCPIVNILLFPSKATATGKTQR